MANGTIHKFGTLVVNGAQYAMPTDPKEGGDCVSYNGTAIGIEDTVSGKELQWIELNKPDGTQLLICDRCLVASISWNSINSAGLVTGKDLTIDGQKYKMRLLTGSTGASGTYGTGCNNEWDMFLDAVGESNDITHWSKMYTWCQEVYSGNSGSRSVRGYGSARGCNYYTASHTFTNVGWRPALEVLNSAPEVTPESKNFGNCAVPPDISVTVSDKDGDEFTGIISVDGEQKSIFTGTAEGTHKIPVDEWWRTMSKSAHTITVSVTDANNSTTTVTYNITKTNGPAEAPVITEPASMQRRTGEFYVYFKAGTDPDGDTQSIAVQTAEDSAFTESVKTFSGLQKKVENEWIDATDISNEDIGAEFRIQVSGFKDGSKQYIRAVSTDSGSQVASMSDTVQVAIGSVLEITTIPAEWDSRPDRIDVKLKASIDSDAKTEMWVSNNAVDREPVWEEYEIGAYHVFANKKKTADKWATAARIRITAQEAAGEISISNIAMGVL